VGVIGGLLVLTPICIILTFFPDFLVPYILFWLVIAVVDKFADWLGCSFLKAGFLLVIFFMFPLNFSGD